MIPTRHSEKRTKLIATVGPASESPETIEAFIKSGVNVFRMNFSHGIHSWHRDCIKRIRRIADSLKIPVAIMQDLQGPRLRTGRLKNGRSIELEDKSKLCITPGDFEGQGKNIATGYAGLPHDVTPGDRMLISDGLIELKVVKISGRTVHCEVVSGGILKENQGINLPGKDLSTTPPTAKDLADLELGAESGVDYVAMSFVSTPGELAELRKEIARLEFSASIVAKIERPQAVENLEEILEESDAVMVARGDLGIEMEPEKVPAIQKHIIRLANSRGIPVITATQMLDSMIKNPSPTRAETSDVANAILDGSDAVMLSGETAVGQHPLKTVNMIVKIAKHAEPLLESEKKLKNKALTHPHSQLHTSSLAEAACSVARDVNAKALAVFTMTGNTARFIARQRPELETYAFTPVEDTYRKLSLVWGIIPLPFEQIETTDKMISAGMKEMNRKGIAVPGDVIVCIAGPSTCTPGGTDMLKLLHF